MLGPRIAGRSVQESIVVLGHKDNLLGVKRTVGVDPL